MSRAICVSLFSGLRRAVLALLRSVCHRQPYLPLLSAAPFLAYLSPFRTGLLSALGVGLLPLAHLVLFPLSPPSPACGASRCPPL
jgi:hypothetical protein